MVGKRGVHAMPHYLTKTASKDEFAADATKKEVGKDISAEVA
jgi:hypothetical protein